MRLRAEITVFLALIFTSVAALICGLVESAHTAGTKFYARLVSDSCIDSLFSEYDTELWKDYKLLLLYTCDEDACDEVKNFAEKYTSENSGFKIGVPVTEVEESIAVTDGGGYYLEQEIVDYMQDAVFKLLFSSEEEVTSLGEDLTESESIESITDDLGEASSSALALEESIKNIAVNLQEQASQKEAAAECLSQGDTEGFYSHLADLESQAARLTDLINAYTVRADDLGEELESIDMEHAEDYENISPENRSNMNDTVLSYHRYTDADGERRVYIESLDDHESDNEGVVSRTKTLIEEIEAAIEEAEREEEEEREREENSSSDDEESGGSYGNPFGGDDEGYVDSGPGIYLSAEADSKKRFSDLVYRENGMDKNGAVPAILDKNDMSAVPGYYSPYALEVVDMSQFDSMWEDAADYFRTYYVGEIKDGYGVEDEEKADMLKQLKEMLSDSVIELVLPGDTEVSEEKIRTPYLPSETDMYTRTEPQRNIIEYALISEYIADRFGCFTDKNKKSLAYEMEYIFEGSKEDRYNLGAAVEAIFAVREGLNYLHILRDSDKRQLSMNAAKTIVGAAGMPALTPLLAALIIGVWAGVESVMDLRSLLSGDEVPLYKKDSEWKTDLDGLLNKGPEALSAGAGYAEAAGAAEAVGAGEAAAAAEAADTGEAAGTGETSDTGKKKKRSGLTYEEYLKYLILMIPADTRNYRILDMIQNNIWQKDADFMICDAIYGMKIKYTYPASHFYTGLSIAAADSGEVPGQYSIQISSEKVY